MQFSKVLILFLASTGTGFLNVEKTHYFLHILQYCSTSLHSLSVTLCSVPVSMKPLLLKTECALIGQLDQCVMIGQQL